jgi:hypothetical protein
MSYGIIEFDEDGKPICEICGKSFDRVLNHVRMKHQINEKDYKRQFGFDLTKGICSAKSAELSRLKNLENYDKVVKVNLIKRGQGTRYGVGSKGRTKDKVSQQTYIRLKDQFKKKHE